MTNFLTFDKYGSETTFICQHLSRL